MKHYGPLESKRQLGRGCGLVIMLDFVLVGPVLGVLSTADLALHLYLDVRKTKRDRTSVFREPLVRISDLNMAVLAFSTFLAFFVVLLIIAAYPLPITHLVIAFMLVIADPPVYVWSAGFGLLCFGILLHGWSRWVRQEMATSWEMRENQVIIKRGPYSRVRHPSYVSYTLTFLGLLLMIPSVVTLLILLGIPAYYSAAIVEERHLVQHFGKAYEEYMQQTGRFLPALGRRSRA